MAISTVKATINGTTTTLTYNSSTGLYEASIAAPSKSSYNNNDGHYYPVTIVASDLAGNSVSVDDTDETLGESCRLTVKETTAPVITITMPTASQYLSDNTPQFTWTLYDADSGIDTSTITMTLDSDVITSANITKAATSSGYTCTYTPTSILEDGEHTATFNVSDYDGNAAVEKSVTFTVDTIAPVLSVTAPVNNLNTSSTSITVSGTTNDETSSSVSVTVYVYDSNGEEVSSYTIESVTNGSFTFSGVELYENDTNTVKVVATDLAGKTTTVTRSVVCDTASPVIHSITLTPNPVNTGAAYTVTVSVEDPAFAHLPSSKSEVG